mgnify:CR=1 FL=1
MALVFLLNQGVQSYLTFCSVSGSRNLRCGHVGLCDVPRCATCGVVLLTPALQVIMPMSKGGGKSAIPPGHFSRAHVALQYIHAFEMM